MQATWMGSVGRSARRRRLGRVAPSRTRARLLVRLRRPGHAEVDVGRGEDVAGGGACSRWYACGARRRCASRPDLLQQVQVGGGLRAGRREEAPPAGPPLAPHGDDGTGHQRRAAAREHKERRERLEQAASKARVDFPGSTDGSRHELSRVSSAKEFGRLAVGVSPAQEPAGSPSGALPLGMRKPTRGSVKM